MTAKLELRVPVPALPRVGAEPPLQEPACRVLLQGQAVLLEVVPASQGVRTAAVRAAPTQVLEEPMAQALADKQEIQVPMPMLERVGAEPLV